MASSTTTSIITIDASGMSSINFSTYMAGYFSGLGTGVSNFYGGGADANPYGPGVVYQNGTQAGFRYTTTPANDKQVLLEGTELAYNYIHHGTGNHGISGQLDSVTLGYFDANTTYTQDDVAQTRTELTGVIAELLISDLGLVSTSADGNTAANVVYEFYDALRKSNLTKIMEILGRRAQHFIGSDGDDVYTGTDHNDIIETADGNDTIDGGGGDDTIDGGDGDDTVVFDGDYVDGGSYSFTTGGNGELIITDSRTTGGTGTDTLTNVEILRFNNLTYNVADHSINYVPTDVSIDNDGVDGDAAADTVVGTLSAEDLANEGGSEDVHAFELIDDADGMFKLNGNDIEVAGDLAAGSHTIRVRVTDSAGHVLEKDLTIVVSNFVPVITSSDAVTIGENTTAVTTVTATDANTIETITYSLSGADADLFEIDPETGALTFKSAPDHEAPKDAGADNVYNVVVRATDSVGAFDEQALVVTVGNVNDNTPVVTSSNKVTIAENKTANGAMVLKVKATDADAGSTLTYSLASSADKALFTIDSATGVLSFKAAADHEKPKDANKDNVYDVKVQVSDGTKITTQSIAVTVGNVNDNAPVITSNGGTPTATVKIAENKTAVTTVKATDADAGSSLTYSLSGADKALFQIDANGKLSFIKAPDHETPKDKGGDNVYDVTVKVSDGTFSDTQALKIEVTDVKGKTLNGTAQGETITGAGEQDTLNGKGGNDTLKGGAADDTLYGGAGADKLYGGAGADTFLFRAKAESTFNAAGRDTIFDFDGKAGDRIDLSGFDANDKKGGIQDFDFIGSKLFSGKAGELRFEKVKGETFVYADTNGDKTADFAIRFDDSISFQKGYFLL